MKKIIAILLIAITIISLVSCNEERAPIVGVGNPNNSGDSKNEPKMYQVSFETNGGSYVSPVTTSVLRSASEPKKQDHVFDGWYLDQQLTQPVVFPLEVTYSRTIYAKWLKIKKIEKVNGSSIKNWTGCSPSIGIDLTGNGFDIEQLTKLGYKIKITASFEAYYTKDYNALWDVGYAGAPIYTYSIQDSSGKGVQNEDRYCSTTAQKRSITITQDASYFKNDNLLLKFSTDNIQNTVYIQNVVITYECVK